MGMIFSLLLNEVDFQVNATNRIRLGRGVA